MFFRLFAGHSFNLCSFLCHLYQVLPSQICIVAEAAVKRRAKLWRPAPGQEGTQIVAARLLPVLSKIVFEGGFHYDSTDPKTFRTRTKTCFFAGALQERIFCRRVAGAYTNMLWRQITDTNSDLISSTRYQFNVLPL